MLYGYAKIIRMAYQKICSAHFHQGANCLPIDARGKQCVMNSLVFLITCSEKDCLLMEPTDLNMIMHYGSSVYCNLRNHGNSRDYIAPTEIPNYLLYKSKWVSVRHKTVVSGFIFMNIQIDNLNLFSLEYAFTKLLTTGKGYLLFVFNQICIGIRFDGFYFYIFDSHSRDSIGMFSPDGNCILGFVVTLDNLCSFLRDLSISMNCNDVNMQFDLHLFEINFLKRKPNVAMPPITIGSCNKRNQITCEPLANRPTKKQKTFPVNFNRNTLQMVDDRHVGNNNCESMYTFRLSNAGNGVCGQIITFEEDLLMINHFHNCVSSGPDFICCCCTQTFFSHSVQDVSQLRCNEKTSDSREKYFGNQKSVNGKRWVCKTCLKAINSGRIPCLWIENGLRFPQKPPELHLSSLEERLVSPRLPFMQLREMPRGGQINLKGNIVNVPADVNNTIRSLPRLVDDNETIMLKLKRRLSYKHHVAFENIRPNKVFSAATWLVKNSTVFQNEGIVVNDSWLNTPHQIQNSNSQTHSETEFESSDHWTEVDNFDERPSGNLDTMLHPIDFREFNEILSLAPGESNTPIGLFQDIHSEVLAFPTIYCGQQRISNNDRLVPLHYSAICKWELRNVDRRVAMCIPNIFFKLKRLQIKQIKDKVTLAMRKWKAKGISVTAGDILSPGFVEKLTMQNDGYRVLRTIRSSPPYWEQAKRDLFAMIRQLGIPTWFCSFSAAETKWIPLLKSLYKLVHGRNLSAEDASQLSWKDKCDLIKADPVTCARYFDFRVQSFIKNILKHKSHPIGEIQDFFYRVEFQQRGSPHIHMLVWIKNAPIHGKNSLPQVTNFVDSYITCSKDQSMPELVNYQTHRHARTCRKQGKAVCRFNFPIPPMQKTTILQPLDDLSVRDKAYFVKKYQDIIEKMNDIQKSESNLEFDDFLQELGLTYEEYILSIRGSITHSKLFLKRSLSENRINNYNTVLLKSWQANMDIQFILDPYACVSYIVSYVSKGQRGLSNLLQQACKEAREQDNDIRQQVRRIGNQFLSHVEIGAQEAAYLVLMMPLRRCTRDVVYVDTNKQNDRTVLLKSFSDLKELPSTSKKVEADNTLKRYKRRPKILETICYADFASWYQLCTRKGYNKLHESDGNSELPETDYSLDSTDDIENEQTAEEEMLSKREIVFHDGTCLRKRHIQKVIYHHYTSINNDSEEYYREQIMLYTSWRNEEKDLMKGHNSYENRFKELEKGILLKRSQYETVEYSLIEHFSEQNETMTDDCSFVDLETQHNELIDQEEIPESSKKYGCFSATPNESDEMGSYDLGQDIGVGRKQVNNILPFKELETSFFLEEASKLNREQQNFFYHVLHWSKTKSEPIYNFLSGGAGVGKSVVLRVLYQALLKYFNHCQGEDPDSCKILLCAPTGKAAHNINGNTIHSAFCIPANQKYDFKPLEMQQLNTFRSKYHDLRFVFIDEISMVGRRLFNYISLRLQEIMGSRKPFGGVSIIAFGDLFQLRPVKDAWIFSEKNLPNFNSLATQIWSDYFTMFELTEIMRQKDDYHFATLLNRLREGNQTQDDLNVLQSRTLANLQSTPSAIKLVPHLFCKRDEVRDHNESLLLHMPFSEQVKIEAIDTVSGNLDRSLHQKVISHIPQDPSKTMGLHKTLSLGLEMPAEMCVNVDVTDGLTNGAMCLIKKFDFRVQDSTRCSIVWVKFDNASIGEMWKTKYKHLYTQEIDSSWVPILETSRNFSLQYFKTYLVARRQFPLQMAAAKTIHKSQGSTLQSAALHFGTRKVNHIHYVGLSRSTSLSGIYILHLNAEKISVCPEVVDEMLRLRYERPLQFCIPNLSMNRREYLTVCFQNCRSLSKHFKSIKNEHNMFSSDIVGFVETRMFYPLDKEYYIEGFHVFCATKDDAPHGIVIYYRNPGYQFYVQTVGGIECVLVVLDNELCICFIYCPPNNCSVANFLNLFSHLQHQVNCSLKIVLMGDFNEDVLKTKTVSDFICTTLKCYQLLHSVTTDYGSCLDHIYIDHVNKLFSCKNYGTLESYYSDHKPIYIILSKQRF